MEKTHHFYGHFGAEVSGMTSFFEQGSVPFLT
jgi:hypothetical protein